MPTSLRQRLGELASSFASSVLDAIRGASLEDLLAQSSGDGRRSAARATVDDGPAHPTRRRGGRLPRRSADDIAGVVEQIISLLRQNSKGLRAEEIRERLGLQAKELPRPLKEALDSGRLSKSGQKRATTYFAKGSGPTGKAKGRAPGRGARRTPAAQKGRGKAAKRGRSVERKVAGTNGSDASAQES